METVLLAVGNGARAGNRRRAGYRLVARKLISTLLTSWHRTLRNPRILNLHWSLRSLYMYICQDRKVEDI